VRVLVHRWSLNMQRTRRTGRAGVIASVALAALGLTSCASAPEQPMKFDIRAESDPRLIERGRYLVYGPAHCASCHGDPVREDEALAGTEIPLSGGRRLDVGALGALIAPNITSDAGAGIGAWSDDALVRSLRYGVSHTGRALAPFMPFAELADRDLQAIISFLRAQSPVAQAAPPHDLTWLGSLVLNVLLEPQGPTAPPPSNIQPERTPEYGRYLAHTVANCHGCHTKRSKLTGDFVGPPFAGGMELTEHASRFITPNLTPVEDGIVRRMTERQFVERFRLRAQLRARSPMPWAAYARMTDDDLGAIYRYLRTLPPSSVPM
jgi:mono/diheme cytochrome c family protein